MRNFVFRDEIKNNPPPPQRAPDQPNRSAPRGAGWVSKFFSQVRVIFIFLLLAAIATFVLAHLNEINALAAEKARLVENTIQKHSAENSIRQHALNYENEVDSAASGQKH
jgi:hypothetical protein